MTRRILPIVEGHGEIDAIPLLPRKMLIRRSIADVTVVRGHRRGEWPKVKRDFERFYKAALNECDRLIWIMDYDCDDCRDPIADASWVVERARLLDRRGAVTAAFLVMEFESLFLWDKRALTRVFGDVVARQALPDNPEIVRNAKGCISSLLPPGQRYKPTVHQARLVGHLDLDILEDRSPSFRRLDGALLKLASSS